MVKINFMNLSKTMVFLDLNTILFQTYSIKTIYHKNEIEILACFWPILAFGLNEKGQKRSRAENPSARAMARTHHH